MTIEELSTRLLEAGVSLRLRWQCERWIAVVTRHAEDVRYAEDVQWTGIATTAAEAIEDALDFDAAAGDDV